MVDFAIDGQHRLPPRRPGRDGRDALGVARVVNSKHSTETRNNQELELCRRRHREGRKIKAHHRAAIAGIAAHTGRTYDQIAQLVFKLGAAAIDVLVDAEAHTAFLAEEEEEEENIIERFARLALIIAKSE